MPRRPWALEEANGAPIADSSGNGINGTAQNGATHGTSDFMVGAQSLVLDGSNDFVDFGASSLLPAARAPRTLCGWGKASTTGGGYRWMAAYGQPGTGRAFFIGRLDDALVGGGYNGDDLVVASFWSSNEWHHICLTYDGTTARMFADGAQVSSAAKNWDLVQQRTFVGRQVNNLEHWNGRVDDVRIYSRALSAADIAYLFAQVR